MKVVVNKKTYTLCSAKQDCEDCNAYIDKSYWKDTPDGGWLEEVYECAFSYIRKEAYDAFLNYRTVDELTHESQPIINKEES